MFDFVCEAKKENFKNLNYALNSCQKKIRRFISAGGEASHQRNDESICQKVDVNGNEIKKSVEEDEAEQKIIRNISCTMNRIKVFIYRRNNEREALREWHWKADLD